MADLKYAGRIITNANGNVTPAQHQASRNPQVWAQSLQAHYRWSEPQSGCSSELEPTRLRASRAVPML